MSASIDRRRFLTYTGAAGVATGAAWVAPTVLGASNAFALVSGSACAYSGKLVWVGDANNQWPSGGTGNDGWIGPNYPSAPNNQGTKVFQAKVGGTGSQYVYVKVTVTSVNDPGSNDNGGTGGPRSDNIYCTQPSWYALFGKDVTANAGYTMQFQFFSDAAMSTPAAVTNLRFGLLDIDGVASATYHESMWITGTNGFARSDGNTNVTGSGTASDPWRNNTTTSNLSCSSPTNGGNISGSFGATPVSDFTVNLVNDGKTGNNHGVGITDLAWGC